MPTLECDVRRIPDLIYTTANCVSIHTWANMFRRMLFSCLLTACFSGSWSFWVSISSVLMWLFLRLFDFLQCASGPIVHLLHCVCILSLRMKYWSRNITLYHKLVKSKDELVGGNLLALLPWSIAWGPHSQHTWTCPSHNKLSVLVYHHSPFFWPFHMIGELEMMLACLN